MTYDAANVSWLMVINVHFDAKLFSSHYTLSWLYVGSLTMGQGTLMALLQHNPPACPLIWWWLKNLPCDQYKSFKQGQHYMFVFPQCFWLLTNHFTWHSVINCFCETIREKLVKNIQRFVKYCKKMKLETRKYFLQT